MVSGLPIVATRDSNDLARENRFNKAWVYPRKCAIIQTVYAFHGALVFLLLLRLSLVVARFKLAHFFCDANFEAALNGPVKLQFFQALR